ncbi:MAG: hypothetical protein P8Y67_14335 [Alphaproteobacteria bacterium]|jgi:hypothetical protein
MKKFLVIATAAVSVMALTADANAWSRKSTWKGPNGGTVTNQAYGHCENGTCTRQGRITGRHGNSVTYGTSTHCEGSVCSRESKITGPGGRTFKRSTTFSGY